MWPPLSFWPASKSSIAIPIGCIARRDIPTARLLAIGETREKALATAREGAQWTIASYARRIPTDTNKDPIQRYVDEAIIHGTPEEVADKLIELRETIGLDYLIASPLSHETFMLFTERVLPRLT